ncbi:MAG: hypothetical protein AAFV74_06055 [Pseudomonadota bacterium]
MDREKFEERLKELPQETVVLIAARAAVRSFPILTRFGEHDENSQTIALSTARAILSSGVAAKFPTAEVMQFTGRASDAAIAAGVYAGHSHAADAVHAAVNTANTALTSRVTRAASAKSAVALAARAATYAAVLPGDAVVTGEEIVVDTAYAEAAVRTDALNDVSLSFDKLLSAPAWQNTGEPEWMVSTVGSRDSLLDAGPEWDFWRRWYRGFLNGDHLDWELQRRVALIEENIWEAGPKAVAAEIARIEAAYEVERRAADVEESASTALSERRGIGDNNPPSTIDDALITSDSTTIIWAAAQDLREEALADAPKKSRVVKALSAIVGVLKACGLYVATKVDLALDTVIVETIKAARVIGTGWLALNTETVQNLVQAVVNWLQFLG